MASERRNVLFILSEWEKVAGRLSKESVLTAYGVAKVRETK